MRVLIFSDMAQTGFGRVGREISTGLLDRGHDIRVIAVNWRGAAGEVQARMRRLGGDTRDALEKASKEVLEDPLLEWMVAASEQGDALGHNLTPLAIHGNLWMTWKPESIVIIGDPQALKDRLRYDQGAFGHAMANGVPVVNYVPIEGEPLPSAYRRFWDRVIPVAQSDYGRLQLERLLGREVAVAYHGVSPAFRPLSPADPCMGAVSKDGAKVALGMEGRTVILRVDRHILRKNYGALFRLMAPVLARHPEALLVVHCSIIDEYGDLRENISTMDGAVDLGMGQWVHPQVKLTMGHDTFRGVPDDELRLLYAAADIYVSPTMAEGFGLCLAESLAVGTPVVSTNYSAITEVVGPGGVLIEPLTYMTSQYAIKWAIVDEVAMAEAVDRLIEKPALRRSLGEAGRRHVAKFQWSAAVDVIDGLIGGYNQLPDAHPDQLAEVG